MDKKTVAAIQSLIQDKSVAKLYEAQEDIFVWLPGWEVPKSEPAAKQ